MFHSILSKFKLCPTTPTRTSSQTIVNTPGALKKQFQNDEHWEQKNNQRNL